MLSVPRFIPSKSWGVNIPRLFSLDPGLHFFLSSENLPQVPPKTQASFNKIMR